MMSVLLLAQNPWIICLGPTAIFDKNVTEIKNHFMDII